MGTKTINAHQNILSDRDDIRITPQGRPEQLSGGDFTPAPGDLWPESRG
jgi:hypothetical protein